MHLLSRFSFQICLKYFAGLAGINASGSGWCWVGCGDHGRKVDFSSGSENATRKTVSSQSYYVLVVPV